MSARFNLIEECKVIGAIVPIDSNAAAKAGDYINMSLCEDLWAILMQGAWAGGTPAVTVGQATSAAGAGAVAVTSFEAWNGTTLTADALTAITVTAGTFNLAATANMFTVVRIRAEALTDGFKYARIEVATPGSNADLLSGLYIASGLKYTGKVPPTMIL